MDQKEKIILNFGTDTPTKPLELTIESRGIAQKEWFFLNHRPTETIEEELWNRKEKKRRAIPRDPPVIIVSCYYAKDAHNYKTIVKTAQLTKLSAYLRKNIQIPYY